MKSLAALTYGNLILLMDVFELISKALLSLNRSDQSPNVNVPFSVENEQHRESQGAKLNLGAIVALGAFGGFVFLAAVITTIVILIRR